MTLYANVAASTSGIVVGTGNKVEDFGVGFYTKYGDGGVDMVLLIVIKQQVWDMGRELNILEEIQMAEPTDGLWSDGEWNAVELGMSYKEIGHLMTGPDEPGYDKYLAIRKKNLRKMKSLMYVNSMEKLFWTIRKKLKGFFMRIRRKLNEDFEWQLCNLWRDKWLDWR